MSSGNAPHPDVLELNFLRTLAQQDVIVDLDAPEDAIALAQSFGTSVEGLGQARQRLGQLGFATVAQVTNRRVRASITPAGRNHLATVDGRRGSDSSRVLWKPWTWF